MADNTIHETNRNTKTARATQETGRTTAKQRPRNPRNRSTSRRITQLGCTLERCLQERRPRSISQQVTSLPTMQADRETIAKTPKHTLKRRQSQWLQNRVVDAKENSSDNTEKFRRRLSTIRCLVHSFSSGLQLPKAGTPCQRTQRAGHRNVAKETLALYKKTHEEAVKPLFFLMKAALCSSLWCVEPGLPEAKHHCFTTGKDTTSSRPLALSVFLPYVINWVCILTSRIQTFVLTILCFLSRNFLFIFQRVLFWFWIAGLCIAGAQNVCREDSPGESSLSGCRLMLLSLIQLSKFGITASIATLPIIFRMMYMSLRKLFVLPSTICVRKNLCYVLSLRKLSLKYDSFH
jgi:hypothetical protein